MDLEKQPEPEKQPQPQRPAAPAETAPAEPAFADPRGALRASDADRDRIADILRDALAEGRLDAEEHSDRIDAVYRAKTVGELEPIVRDLPAARTSRPGPEPAYSYGPDDEGGAPDNLVAVFSSTTRKGRWRVSRRTNAFALFGNIEIDLTEAIFAQRLTTINATSIFGNVEVRVPENISLRGNGSGIFGNFEVVTLEGVDPQAPVVVINGYSVFGNVEARPKRGKWITDLQDKMRKHLGH
ncbi:hypothetical protein GCM10010497_04680 [Streptomyces cinereoruber]|uniref:DUF1707 and DUF2154 domain-containing protein n=1 Tax=Streptomyces cinereoruber TaxID=67260 RepID=A0AAV4KF12_9ACTN|nr:MULTISPECIES: DUF1707 domain-containing protein [Streptomyces]AVH95686.1 DUF1707 domain-containing protein [Streptomyces sp. WAC00288]KYG54360.1 hypothetical protein AWI43_07725 [Streptomyces sp. WAC04657]MBB4157341.1 hypothetical protein [Streptomyces cinereoruber]MBY8814846.1 DUF1707 domain-containing protein [Streptomyces cinereoruber]NIH59561.1 hypothetical protein [Streptomyces cinereoruber]